MLSFHRSLNPIHDRTMNRRKVKISDHEFAEKLKLNFNILDLIICQDQGIRRNTTKRPPLLLQIVGGGSLGDLEIWHIWRPAEGAGKLHFEPTKTRVLKGKRLKTSFIFDVFAPAAR